MTVSLHFVEVWRRREGAAVTGAPDPPGTPRRVSQAEIYDERFAHEHYDRRSAVPVLTAEWETFGGALVRAGREVPGDVPLTVLDWGYGTGRVTNDALVQFPRLRFPFSACTSLRLERDVVVVASDVSGVGLRKAVDRLRAAGFRGPELRAGSGVVGELSCARDGREAVVRFVRGDEDDDPAATEDLLTAAGAPFHVTVSWYSALGHIPFRRRRAAVLAMLGRVTHPRGELVLSVSSLGDLVAAQREWAERLGRGDVEGFPIEEPGDVVYETELGQRNYYHVFGPELPGLVDVAVTDAGQRVRVHGIRGLDDEFADRAAERLNYDRVRRLNRACRTAGWAEADYRKLHTIAVVRCCSGVAPGDPDHRLLGY